MGGRRGESRFRYRPGPNDMPLEFWILLALVVGAAILGATVRLRRRRAREAAVESGGESKVYPLW